MSPNNLGASNSIPLAVVRHLERNDHMKLLNDTMAMENLIPMSTPHAQSISRSVFINETSGDLTLGRGPASTPPTVLPHPPMTQENVDHHHSSSTFQFQLNNNNGGNGGNICNNGAVDTFGHSQYSPHHISNNSSSNNSNNNNDLSSQSFIQLCPVQQTTTNNPSVEDLASETVTELINGRLLPHYDGAAENNYVIYNMGAGGEDILSESMKVLAEEEESSNPESQFHQHHPQMVMQQQQQQQYFADWDSCRYDGQVLLEQDHYGGG